MRLGTWKLPLSIAIIATLIDAVWFSATRMGASGLDSGEGTTLVAKMTELWFILHWPALDVGMSYVIGEFNLHADFAIGQWVILGALALLQTFLVFVIVSLVVQKLIQRVGARSVSL